MSESTSLLEKLGVDIKAAMKKKDKVRLRTLRSLRAALMNKQIESREGGEDQEMPEQEELAVVRKQVKQREDSIEQFDDAGRDDLAQKEREELEVLAEYMPAKLSDEELLSEVQAIVDDVGASSMSDMGTVMGRAMGELRGRADGGRVQQVVKKILSS